MIISSSSKDIQPIDNSMIIDKSTVTCNSAMKTNKTFAKPSSSTTSKITPINTKISFDFNQIHNRENIKNVDPHTETHRVIKINNNNSNNQHNNNVESARNLQRNNKENVKSNSKDPRLSSLDKNKGKICLKKINISHSKLPTLKNIHVVGGGKMEKIPEKTEFEEKEKTLGNDNNDKSNNEHTVPPVTIRGNHSNISGGGTVGSVHNAINISNYNKNMEESNGSSCNNNYSGNGVYSTNNNNNVNNTNNNMAAETKKSLFNAEKFAELHNRNLDLIKKLSNKFSLIHNQPKRREETSMERYNKIKKFFGVGFSGLISDELSRKRQASPLPSEIIKRDEKVYYYQIQKGNNMELIKKCMSSRLRWKDIEMTPNGYTLQSQLHLVWAPTSGSIKFSETIYYKDKEKLQMANHYENYPALCNKFKMFENMMKYCENNDISVFDYVPFTILIQYESDKYLKQFSNFEYFFNHIQDFYDRDNPNREIKENSSTNLNENNKDDKGNKEKEKDKEHKDDKEKEKDKEIILEQRDFRAKYADYFHLESKEKIGYKTNINIPKNHYAEKNLWLVKAINLNRGRCIKVIDSIEKADSTIKSFYSGVVKGFKASLKEDNSKSNSNCNLILPKIMTKVRKHTENNKSRKIDYSVLNIRTLNQKKYQSSVMILQKYIEQPALYYGRKFDIRIWVLFTHNYEVYVFREGHLKATSIKYDLNSTVPYVHLTNYSVQKYNENFSKFETGNEISFGEFETSIYNDCKRILNFRSEIFPKLCDIIRLSFKSVIDTIVAKERRLCFEIYGYDFMLDKDLNPFLIEINTNPGLEISSPLIGELVPRMVDDALRLTIDDVFKTEYEWGNSESEYQSKFHVDGYSDSENMWQFLESFSDKVRRQFRNF